MSTSKIKGRSAYWDNIKGLLMLLTVFAHILLQLEDRHGIINEVVDIIYMFHMPAFVFVSGFFGKSERSRSPEAILRLVILFYIFNSICGFVYGFTSLLMPVYSYWYLIALIAWRLTAHRIAKFKEITLILFTVGMFAGFYPSIDNTFSAARIIGFYPFYMSGFLLSKEKSEELINKKYVSRALPGSAAAAAGLVISCAAFSYFKFTDDALQMAGYEEPPDAFGRLVLYLIAFLAIYSLRHVSPEKKIPFLTKTGQNSLWIFILHRPITLYLSDHMENLSPALMIVVSLAAAVLICAILGNGFVVRYLDKLIDGCMAVFVSEKTEGKKKFDLSKTVMLCVSLFFIVNVVLGAYAGLTLDDLKKLINGETVETEEKKENDSDSDIIYPVMSPAQKEQFDKAFRITFAGDLILLEDQVKRAYNGSGYDFSEVFEYAEPYISSADLAIGVFEGPMAGAEAGYSSSNFDDGKTLSLNFPDEFAAAVKNAGFDLVTTANNHVLDKGIDGALRTLDVLDGIGLDNTGSYRNAEEKEKEHIKLVECQGIRIAVLSYTYGSNDYDDTILIDGELSYVTSVISGTEGEQFEVLKDRVKQDFADAKALSPDLIIVMPHIGTQFSNAADEEQKVWFDLFKECGADIILGDHPHVVEPALIEDCGGRKVFTAYCPGNFANIYRKDQGDTSMLTDVYIDRETKQVVGGSIVPLYTHARADGNFRAVPIYDIMNDSELRRQLTTDDIELAANANSIITEVVFGHKMDITSVTEKYYFDESGFLRSKAAGVGLTDTMRAGLLYSRMEKAETICFVGDSVTEGTKNGGCPWYEPIEELFTGKNILNYSKGGCTASYMLDRAGEIPEAELYVIALGTNDVRYRDPSVCAMTAEDFVSALGQLKNKLSEKNSGAEFIFVAPWYSTDGDPYCVLRYADKTALNDQYSDALERYCSDNSLGFINANTYIRNVLSAAPDRKYLLDHIHPNASAGVVMYSEAALSSGRS